MLMPLPSKTRRTLRGAIVNTIDVVLALQRGPWTVNDLAWELQADERAVRRVVYTLRDMDRVQRSAQRPVGRNGALKAVVWEWAHA